VTFSQWQPIYAEHGIAMVPVSTEKKPLVKNPQKFGVPASTEIATKFADATAFGYYTGRGSGITVLDVDSANENVLADAFGRHGPSPIIVQTHSEKFPALYRHNGERRIIRPWGEELEIDILGATGLCIAPPSVGAKGRYQIIEGSLDDLDRLPIMRGLEECFYKQRHVGPRPQRKGEGRNNRRWRRAMQEAHHVSGFEQLLDRVETLNQEYAEPMQQVEVTKIAKSAWGYTERGENWFGRGRQGVRFAEFEVDALIGNQDAFILLAFLRAKQGSHSTFMIANGLAEKFGWGRHRLADARRALIERSIIKTVRAARQHEPALYRWALPVPLY
jgi:hypothetical protein